MVRDEVSDVARGPVKKHGGVGNFLGPALPAQGAVVRFLPSSGILGTPGVPAVTLSGKPQ